MAELTNNEMQSLKNTGTIDFIEPDYQVTVSTVTYQNVNINENTWGYDTLQGDEIHQSGFLGQGIKLALIDTGINNHPDLHISGGISVIQDTYRYNDDNGHGTQMAGIISSQINGIGMKGIAPSAELYSVKAFNSAGQSNYSNLISAIDWAIDNDINIINLSVTSEYYSKAFDEALSRASQSGILIVASAGNKGESSIAYPARLPYVISVGSIGRDLLKSSFSNYGSKLDLMAPGSLIYTTDANGAYSIVNGTSASAAFVSASAAALWSAHPDWTALQIRSALLNSARQIGSATSYGYGLVSPFDGIKGIKYRQVNLSSDGTVTDVTYGQDILNIATYGKYPDTNSQLYYGQAIYTFLRIEDEITEVKIETTDPMGKTVDYEERINGIDGVVLEKDSPISYQYVPLSIE